MGKTKLELKYGLPALIALVVVAISAIFYISKSSNNDQINHAGELSSNNCQEVYEKDSKVEINRQEFDVQLAETSAEQEKGLGGRSCIDANEGMLFEFNQPDLYSFWMKDMKFPIDIIWINQDKEVVKILNNVSPNTYPRTFTNEAPAKYVLELKANAASILGVKNGTEINF